MIVLDGVKWQGGGVSGTREGQRRKRNRESEVGIRGMTMVALRERGRGMISC